MEDHLSWLLRSVDQSATMGQNLAKRTKTRSCERREEAERVLHVYNVSDTATFRRCRMQWLTGIASKLEEDLQRQRLCKNTHGDSTTLVDASGRCWMELAPRGLRVERGLWTRDARGNLATKRCMKPLVEVGRLKWNSDF